MRFSKILIVLCALIFSFGLNYSDAGIFDEENPTIPYEQECSGDDCLREGINATSGIGAIETKRKSSEYLQDVVIYSITFLTLLAVIYIIYAGFYILTGAGDDEKAKKSKSIIIYVIVGIALIWLAFPITIFVFRLLSGPNSF